MVADLGDPESWILYCLWEKPKNNNLFPQQTPPMLRDWQHSQMGLKQADWFQVWYRPPVLHNPRWWLQVYFPEMVKEGFWIWGCQVQLRAGVFPNKNRGISTSLYTECWNFHPFLISLLFGCWQPGSYPLGRRGQPFSLGNLSSLRGRI